MSRSERNVDVQAFIDGERFSVPGDREYPL